MKYSDGKYFEPPQVNMEDNATENGLGQILAAATICKQLLANNIPMKRLTQEQWGEDNNTTNYSICAKPFKSTNEKTP